MAIYKPDKGWVICKCGSIRVTRRDKFNREIYYCEDCHLIFGELAANYVQNIDYNKMAIANIGFQKFNKEGERHDEIMKEYNARRDLLLKEIDDARLEAVTAVNEFSKKQVSIDVTEEVKTFQTEFLISLNKLESDARNLNLMGAERHFKKLMERFKSFKNLLAAIAEVSTT